MSFFEFPHTRTYDTDLGWLIKHVSDFDDIIKTLDEWIATNTPKIDELIEFMHDMENVDTLPEGVKQAIYAWCREHIVDLVGELVHNVFFGLTDDGHFIAYIPDSWDDITFNTTEYDTNIELCPEFGHLVLSY